MTLLLPSSLMSPSPIQTSPELLLLAFTASVLLTMSIMPNFGATQTTNYIISASSATRMCIFAMESYGGLHKSSEALLRYLADSKYPGVGPGGSGDTDGLRARFIGTSRQRVSVACMKGNSTILQRFRKVCLRLTPAVPVV